MGQLDQQQFDQKRRAEDLLEISLELRAQPETNQAAKANVVRRASEGFHMGGINSRLADLLDIGRMAQSRQSMAVKELEDLGIAAANAKQEDSVGQADGKDGRAALELFTHVFAAVADGFQPAI